MTMKNQGTTVDYKKTVINGKSYYGKHLTMTAKGRNETLLEVPTISEFLKSPVPRLDINACDMARDMYWDVFSCKWFDEAIVRDVINSIFAPEEITEQIVLRS